MAIRIRKIVVGVANVRKEDPVLRPALQLATALGAELHVVHAFPLADPLLEAYARMGYLGGQPAEPQDEQVAEALGMLVGELSAKVPVHSHAIPGTAASAVTEIAERIGADLVVVGGTRRGTLARTILGTTAQQVLRGSRVPVLMLRRETHEGLRRVLLTTDLSAFSAEVHDRAVEVVDALAAGAEPEMRSLFVIGQLSSPVPIKHELLEQVANEEFGRFLEERVPRPGGVERRIREGDPAKEIVTEAAEWGADLIVLGTHSRRGASRILLGSVAEAAVRGALGNVLIVPAPYVNGDA